MPQTLLGTTAHCPLNQQVDCVNKDFDSSYHSVGCDGGQTTEALQYAARCWVLCAGAGLRAAHRMHE